MKQFILIYLKHIYTYRRHTHTLLYALKGLQSPSPSYLIKVERVRGFVSNRTNDKTLSIASNISYLFSMIVNSMWCVCIYNNATITETESRQTVSWKSHGWSTYRGVWSVRRVRTKQARSFGSEINLDMFPKVYTPTCTDGVLQIINTLVYFCVLGRDDIFAFWRKIILLIIANYILKRFFYHVTGIAYYYMINKLKVNTANLDKTFKHKLRIIKQSCRVYINN